MDELKIEFDPNRGVLWVHSPKGFSVLRICGLPWDLADRVKHAMKTCEMVDVSVTGWQSS